MAIPLLFKGRPIGERSAGFSENQSHLVEWLLQLPESMIIGALLLLAKINPVKWLSALENGAAWILEEKLGFEEEVSKKPRKIPSFIKRVLVGNWVVNKLVTGQTKNEQHVEGFKNLLAACIDVTQTIVGAGVLLQFIFSLINGGVKRSLESIISYVSQPEESLTNSLNEVTAVLPTVVSISVVGLFMSLLAGNYIYHSWPRPSSNSDVDTKNSAESSDGFNLHFLWAAVVFVMIVLAAQPLWDEVTSPEANAVYYDAGRSTTHNVQAGESLSTIAQLYGVSWQDLAIINNIAAPYYIYPGDDLMIP